MGLGNISFVWLLEGMWCGLCDITVDMAAAVYYQ
jgi:hypothetical protein